MSLESRRARRLLTDLIRIEEQNAERCRSMIGLQEYEELVDARALALERIIELRRLRRQFDEKHDPESAIKTPLRPPSQQDLRAVTGIVGRVDAILEEGKR